MVAFVIYDIMEFVKYMYMVKVFLRCWVVSYAYKMLIINGFTSIHWQIIKEFYVQLSLHPATVYYHESSICKPPPPPKSSPWSRALCRCFNAYLCYHAIDGCVSVVNLRICISIFFPHILASIKYKSI